MFLVLNPVLVLTRPKALSNPFAALSVDSPTADAEE
jgi:hypothetical protein